MELEELKNVWVALDNKLQKNEVLNERVVKEMLQSKANKALNLLNRFEFIGAIICFIALPFLIFRLGTMKHTLWMEMMVYCGIALVFSGCITQSYKLWLLLKIDLNNLISENIKFLQKYNLFIKREKMAAWIYTPILFASIIFTFISLNNIELWRWVAVISVLIFSIILAIWQYKKIYDVNIQSIKKSLEELKELEEEN